MFQISHSSLVRGATVFAMIASIAIAQYSDRKSEAACAGAACQTGAYVRVHSTHLEEMLDNLETATPEQRQRIKGFHVLLSFLDQDNTEAALVSDRIAEMNTQMQRARGMGFEAIPGFIWQFGRGAPDYNGNGTVDGEDMWNTYFDPAELQERLDDFIKPAYALRAPGDNRMVFDYEPYTIRASGYSDHLIGFAKETGHDHELDTIRFIAAAESIFQWAQQENVHLLMHPANTSSPLLMTFSAIRPMTHQTEGIFNMPFDYYDNPTNYDRLIEERIIDKCLEVEAQLPNTSCQPGFNAGAVRDRAQEFRDDIANYIDSYWIFPDTVDDGPQESWFTGEWFAAP